MANQTGGGLESGQEAVQVPGKLGAGRCVARREGFGKSKGGAARVADTSGWFRLSVTCSPQADESIAWVGR